MTSGEAKQGLKARAIDEVVRFAIIAAYLWVMFLLFQIHEYVVLAEHHISFDRWGFGLVNALVLGKVMLIADDLRFGARFTSGPLIYPILFRSALFAALFIVVDILEKLLVGAFHGKTIGGSIPTYGGGGLLGTVLVAIIITFALTPFFAFQEISRAMGPGELGRMLVGRRPARQPAGQNKPNRLS